MAFNFNWLPLNTSSTSTAFYTNAKALLTAALNKSAKPPIIVDDIFVDDLHLGESAPDLEILEIGDIAEDRFRGIFRMNYAGDAFLTLRTKVQANPLNTYLSTAPSFTSPGPLEASSPLTIPVQITLSDFRLSGFVILVFSKAKGITVVFRNDPLESLKVSSTFDSIPFIADYLQKEIERQVRRLFQEELPVAVHRLSLRLFNPEYAASLSDSPTTSPTTAAPADEDYDSDLERLLDPLQTPAENSDELFSTKNLHALGSLIDSTKTLSLVTPKLSDVVFRAWASGNTHHTTPLFDRAATLESAGSGTATPYPASEAGDEPRSAMHSRRPSIYSHASTTSVTSAASSRTSSSTPNRRRKKHRVVNLRKRSTPATPVPEESAVEDKFDPAPPPPMHHREDSIDYESRPTRSYPASPDSVATEDITYPPQPPSPKIEKQHIPMPKVEVETGLPTAAQEKERLRREEEQPRVAVHGSILEQAFVHKVVKEMRRRIREEREGRGKGEGMWAVERELENIEGVEQLPAYGA